jgi:hypothetical protein
MKPTIKEIKCIEFARQFYTTPTKLSFIKNIFGKKQDLFIAKEQTVSTNKTFSQLWSDYGLRNYGIEYIHRGKFSADSKLLCIKEWVKILFESDIDIFSLKSEIIDRNTRTKIEMHKKGISGIVMADPIDQMDNEIDKIFGVYQK